MSREFIYRIWSIKEKKYVMTGSLYGVEGVAHLTGCYKDDILPEPQSVSEDLKMTNSVGIKLLVN